MLLCRLSNWISVVVVMMVVVAIIMSVFVGICLKILPNRIPQTFNTVIDCCLIDYLRIIGQLQSFRGKVNRYLPDPCHLLQPHLNRLSATTTVHPTDFGYERFFRVDLGFSNSHRSAVPQCSDTSDDFIFTEEI